MKVTQNQITKMRKLRRKGEKIEDIAKKFKVSNQTITYWTNDESRKKANKKRIENFASLTLKQRKKIYKNRLPYLTDYQRKRYNKDKTFREKKKKCSKKYYLETVKG